MDMTGRVPARATDWLSLRRLTPARVALGMCGQGGVPTQAMLDFTLAHARARDAVHAPLDWETLRGQFQAMGLPTLEVASAAATRQHYLRRPDLGRRLAHDATPVLEACRLAEDRVVIVVADGLSSIAVARHAAALVAALRPLLPPDQQPALVVLAHQGRVAIGDAIGQALHARMAIVLIGERPGLSTTDSLGAYLTWQPRVGCDDAMRNCISNIHPAGLGYAAAARIAAGTLACAHRQRRSGVALALDIDIDAGADAPLALSHAPQPAPRDLDSS